MMANRKELSDKLKKLKDIIMKDSGALFRDGKIIASNPAFALSVNFDCGNIEDFVLPTTAISFIENMADDEIELQPSKNKIVIKGKRNKGTFATVAPSIYHVSEPEANDTLLAFADDDFLRAANSVTYACSVIETRPAQMGVLLDSDENGKLNIIASDGIKLAANSVDYNGEIRAVIPKAAFKKLLSISRGNGITLKKTSSTNQLAFETGEYTLFVQLLENNFFNYKPLLELASPSSENELKINSVSLLNALQRAKICEGTKRSAIVMTLEESMNTVMIKTTDSLESFSEEIVIENTVDKAVSVAFNGDYMSEMLHAAGTDNPSTTLTVTGSGKPIIVKSADGFIGLLQPIRMKK